MTTRWERLHEQRARPGLGGALIALLVVGLLVSGWQGWRVATGDESVASSSASERDAALASAGDALVRFNTVDYRHMGATLDEWSKVSSGKLHASVLAGRKAVRREVTRARTMASARLLRSALTSFDGGAGTATIAAVLEIRTRTKGGDTKTRATRFAGLVQRTGGTWKLSAMQTMEASS